MSVVSFVGTPRELDLAWIVSLRAAQMSVGTVPNLEYNAFMAKESIGVLVSGGLDSAVLLAESARTYRKVCPIYVRQNLAWEEVELYWLKKFIQKVSARAFRPLKIFSCPMDDLYGDHWSTGRRSVPGAWSKDKAVYLPGRNLILSLKPAIFATMNKIPLLALGSLDHNPFSDAAPAFFHRWSAVLSAGLGVNIRIIAPYRHLSKVNVIRRGRAWPLHLSFSCIAPEGKFHCGRCNKCAERRRAFVRAGVMDRTVYARREARFFVPIHPSARFTRGSLRTMGSMSTPIV